MWALGLVAFYLFYRVGIVYYLGMPTKGSMLGPLASIYSWFHPTMITISVVLFLASALLFSLTTPWLAIAPLPLTVIALLVSAHERKSRMDLLIENAVEIQVRMEREGRRQSETNRAVYLGATGRICSLDTDMELKSFMKCYVLSEALGFDANAGSNEKKDHTHNPRHMSESEWIDAAIDALYAQRVQAHEDREAFHEATNQHPVSKFVSQSDL